MNPIFIIFTTVTSLFIVLLIIKQIIKFKFCVICASVSLTWISLLLLYWMGMFPYPILIGVLMGQSVVGIYYLIERKTKERLHIFRLPFLLTATLFVFMALGYIKSLSSSLVLLGTLWVILGLIYIHQSNPQVKKIANRLIACCKNW